jgi:hypothetical protein
VRIPGCIVLVPVAAWVGWVIFAALMVAALHVAAWIEDGTIPWP